MSAKVVVLRGWGLGGWGFGDGEGAGALHLLKFCGIHIGHTHL